MKWQITGLLAGIVLMTTANAAQARDEIFFGDNKGEKIVPIEQERFNQQQAVLKKLKNDVTQLQKQLDKVNALLEESLNVQEEQLEKLNALLEERQLSDKFRPQKQPVIQPEKPRPSRTKRQDSTDYDSNFIIPLIPAQTPSGQTSTNTDRE